MNKKILVAAAAAMIALSGTIILLSGPGKVDLDSLKLKHVKCEAWDTFTSSNGRFLIQNNMWGYNRSQQCILKYRKGYIGWNWNRERTSSRNPNFPEIIYGKKPWSNYSTNASLPLKIGNIEKLEARNLGIRSNISGNGKWDTALEIWITSEKPKDNAEQNITDEIIIMLESHELDSANLIDKKAIESSGHSYSYLQYPNGPEHRYHQFKNQGNRIPEEIDLLKFLKYIQKRQNLSKNYWVAGIELGNEYWDRTKGKTVITSLTYQINQQTHSIK